MIENAIGIDINYTITDSKRGIKNSILVYRRYNN